MNTKSASNKKPGLNIALAYQGFLNEPVPSTIFDAIVSGKMGLAFRVLKAALILTAGALIAVIVLNVLNGNAEKKVTSLSAHDLAVSSHTTYAQDHVYPVQVGVEDKAHLVDWLSYRMGKQIQLEQLAERGYTLLGGNIIPDGNTVSASIVYENQDDTKLSMFVRNTSGLNEDSKPELGRSGPVNWLSWQDKGRQIVLVSELDQSALEGVYAELH